MGVFVVEAPRAFQWLTGIDSPATYVPFCASCFRRLTVVRSRRSVVPFGAEIVDLVVESAEIGPG